MEIVEPKTVDGIEFYISKDGLQSGMSIRGIARLCGTDAKSISRLVTGLEPGQKTTISELESLQDKDLCCGITSHQLAKVIDSQYVAEIVTYYAFSKNSETARFSLKKFASIGIHTWVKSIVGYATDDKLDALATTMAQMMGMVTDLQTDMKILKGETESYRSAKVTSPGIEDWLSLHKDLVMDNQQALQGELLTLKEYAQQIKGVELTKSAMARFSNHVSYLYQSMQKELPAQKRPMTARGYSGPATNAYRPQDYPLLEWALAKTMTGG